MSSKERTNWEVGRFLKTANYYGALTPKLPFFDQLSSIRVKFMPKDVIWSKTKAQPGVEWGPLDDVVMGGASRSDLEPGQKFDGTWSGRTTTANNGGFSGIRTKLLKRPFDASACTGVELKLTGDGQRYKLMMRDDPDWNGVAWCYSFDTKKDKPVTVKVPFEKLKPTRFARVLKEYGKYDSSRITAVQLSLSKFEYDGDLNLKFNEGPFKVEVESIAVY